MHTQTRRKNLLSQSMGDKEIAMYYLHEIICSAILLRSKFHLIKLDLCPGKCV